MNHMVMKWFNLQNLVTKDINMSVGPGFSNNDLLNYSRNIIKKLIENPNDEYVKENAKELLSRLDIKLMKF